MTPLPPPPPHVGIRVHCCVCLQAGRSRAATWVTDQTLAACDEHAAELQRRGIGMLYRRRGAA